MKVGIEYVIIGFITVETLLRSSGKTIYRIGLTYFEKLGASINTLYSYVWAIPRHLNFMYRRFGTLCSILIGGVSRMNAYTTYEYGTEGSETSVHKIQTSENRPQVRMQHSEQGESLKFFQQDLPRFTYVLWPLEI